MFSLIDIMGAVPPRHARKGDNHNSFFLYDRANISTFASSNAFPGAVFFYRHLDFGGVNRASYSTCDLSPIQIENMCHTRIFYARVMLMFK
jgi:hypothetical protein